MSTIDGRILSANWDKNFMESISGLYERCHNSFDGQAWMCGRVTFEKDFTKGEQPELWPANKPFAREPFVADSSASSFAVAIDPKGKLGWSGNEIAGDHIITILSEEVSDDYLYYLQRRKISYLFAGSKEINFKLAVEQLSSLFPVNTILLEGGGHINGSLLNEGLIDELSILLIPVADGSVGAATLFDVNSYLAKQPATMLMLKEVQQLDNGVLWLKYLVKHSG